MITNSLHLLLNENKEMYFTFFDNFLFLGNFLNFLWHFIVFREILEFLNTNYEFENLF